MNYKYPKDLTGMKFTRLTAIEEHGKIGKVTAWLCKCDCGNFKVVLRNNLLQGSVKSCGCLTKEIASERGIKSRIGDRTRKHGDFGTKLYGIWAAIKRRCSNPNTKHYEDYGGRGIKVCDAWLDYIGFKEWATLSGYKEGLTIERIDVNGNYCPENCSWIPLEQQASNTRRSVHVEYNGKVYSIKEIAEITGLKPRTILGRYQRGWKPEELFDTNLYKSKYDRKGD